MPKLILDVMGGDHAPRATIEGAIQALSDLSKQEMMNPPFELLLVGDEKVVRPMLAKRKYRALGEAIALGDARPGCKVRLIHSAQNIDMDDSIRAIRSKPQASINVGCRLASEAFRSGGKDSAAFVSAGHSGAMMASALLNMGRLPGAERPAIAVKLPTLSPDGCVVLDVGANIDCKPEHLRDFAVMGALYGSVDRQSKNPVKLGVLSNGEERSKGTEVTRAALELIEKHPVFTEGPLKAAEFVGYVEGKEIFKGQVDVVVTDGFVGNVVLKTSESLASAIFAILKRAAKKNPLMALGLLLASPELLRIKRKTDYAETGAAPLLGVEGYAFIAHGRSNPRAIKNALLRARSALLDGYVERMAKALSSAEDKLENTKGAK